jgi:threonine dehydratase
MTVQTTTASLAQLPVTFSDVEAAAATIAGLVKCTNFDRSRTLSDITGADVWLKFENLQFTATFKERGALNRLSALSAEQRQRGVIAASAGNHAQGVAYHAARLSIPATIYVPVGTPTVKIENTRRHGATVIEGGATLEEAAALATTHGRNEQLTFIHPYDDPLIIAGQGTIALEMLADFRHGGRRQDAQAGYRGDRRASQPLSFDVQPYQATVASDAW